MITISIPRDLLAASACFSAKKDIRYYLNGVKLETGANGARLISTNGHCLSVAYISGEFEPCEVIIPSSLMPGKGNGSVLFTIHDPDEGKTYRRITAFSDIETCANEIEGKFPDYAKVLPTEISGETAQFSTENLTVIAKAAGALRAKWPTIAHNGSGAALVNFNNDRFCAVLMPMRGDVVTKLPDWAFPKTVAPTIEASHD